MSAIHESAKALFSQAIWQMREHLLEGDKEKASRIEIVLTEVFNNTVSDNANLLEALKKAEQSILAAGGKPG